MKAKNIIKYGKYFSNRKFINFVKHIGKNLTFLRQALILFFCLQDKKTPIYVKAVIAGALGYLILPTDAIPDVIAGLGWLDDVAILGAALKIANSYITDVHKEKANRWAVFGKDSL